MQNYILLFNNNIYFYTLKQNYNEAYWSLSFYEKYTHL